MKKINKFLNIFVIVIMFMFALVLTGCDISFVGDDDDDETNYCKDGEHEASEWKVITEATCTTNGLEGTVCTKCGKVLESQTIEATGHTVVTDDAVEATCEHTGLTEGSHCSVCNEVIVKQETIPESHDYQVIDSKEATSEEEGYITYKCTKCNNEYTKVLSKLGSYDPNSATEISMMDNASVVENDNGGVTITGNTITISLAGEYTLSGTLTEGNVVISVGEDDKVTINLVDASITCTTTYPIYCEQADKLKISAKDGTVNYIYDKRTYDSEGTGGAIYACCDLDIQGKGRLVISATYNNGIATKDDLDIKNLTLEVTAPNNALKGNDSLTIESGTITAISTLGDALKTENSDLSSKGNQRGTITIMDGTINLYSACDGIDASYDAVIQGGTVNIYTDSNSSYSGEVSATSSSKMYVKFSSRMRVNSTYKLSAYFTSSDSTTTWVNGTYTSSGMQGYYELSKPSDAKYVKFYLYSSSQSQGQSSSYSYATDQLTINTSCDCYSISSASSSRISGQWTNFSTQSSGFGPGGGMGGGMNDGNSNKADYSCKGIKADNEVTISGGTILIKAHDDAIHANNDVVIESTSANGSGNVTISGGTLTLSSDDDGIHGDGNVTISGGNIVISSSYEGVEGNYIYFQGGTTQIASSDDGINAITNLTFSGGLVYLNANGDGIDSNNTVSMTGGVVLALGPTNGGNGVVDYERSFSFSGGLLLAIGCSGMNQKPTATSGNTSTSKTISTSTSSYVHVTVGGEIVATIKVVKSSQNYCVLAYNNTTYPSASVTVNTTNNNELVNNLYYVK